jgi:hypothetical protein
MQDEKLTTHEVLKRCEITSSKTLTRWHQQRLIPPPSIETHPIGRGKIAYWPKWIVYRIREVKSRLAGGATLAQIAQDLGSDWEAEEKRWFRKKPALYAAWARADRIRAADGFAELGADLVYELLRAIGVQRPGISDELEQRLSASDLVDEILKLLRQGYSPVVVMLGEESKVIPDFLLASVLSHPQSPGQPMLVLPIGALFTEAFARVEPRLPKQPTYLPAMRVLERIDTKVRARKYRHKGKWKFALED